MRGDIVVIGKQTIGLRDEDISNVIIGRANVQKVWFVFDLICKAISSTPFTCSILSRNAAPSPQFDLKSVCTNAETGEASSIFMIMHGI